MRKLTEKLVGKVLPKAKGKAASARGGCYNGCGTSGVWVESGRQGGGRALCC